MIKKLLSLFKRKPKEPDKITQAWNAYVGYYNYLIEKHNAQFLPEEAVKAEIREMTK